MIATSGADPANVLGYKYLEALPSVAAGEANKLMLVPAGASDAMAAVAGLGAAFATGAAAPAPPTAPKPAPARPRQTPPDQVTPPEDPTA